MKIIFNFQFLDLYLFTVRWIHKHIFLIKLIFNRHRPFNFCMHFFELFLIWHTMLKSLFKSVSSVNLELSQLLWWHPMRVQYCLFLSLLNFWLSKIPHIWRIFPSEKLDSLKVVTITKSDCLFLFLFFRLLMMMHCRLQ